MELDPVPIAETWGRWRISSRGLVRHIGISNFGVSLIRDLLPMHRSDHVCCKSNRSVSGPAEIAGYCQQENIAFTAFSPLGAPSYVPLGMAKESDSVLDEPLVKSIAARVGKTPAQVVLAWGINRGTSVIPKTGRTERLTENLAAQTIQLTPADIALSPVWIATSASMILACFANRRSTPFTLFTSKLRPRMLRVLHTADWHLGRSLHGHRRLEECQSFLNWLFEVIRAESIDVVLVAGDVFDTVAPSTRPSSFTIASLRCL